MENKNEDKDVRKGRWGKEKAGGVNVKKEKLKRKFNNSYVTAVIFLN
jgi:hypothetical protein